MSTQQTSRETVVKSYNDFTKIIASQLVDDVKTKFDKFVIANAPFIGEVARETALEGTCNVTAPPELLPIMVTIVDEFKTLYNLFADAVLHEVERRVKGFGDDVVGTVSYPLMRPTNGLRPDCWNAKVTIHFEWKKVK